MSLTLLLRLLYTSFNKTNFLLSDETSDSRWCLARNILQKNQPVKSSANLWRINPRTYKRLEKRCIATMQQSLKDVSTQLWFYLQSRTGRLFRWIARALWKMFQAYSGIFPQKIFPRTDPISSARLHTTRRFLPRNMSRALVKLSVLSSLKPER